VASTFTRAHRGGSGAPLVCVHGFTDTWRTWELVLPALEARHDVLAPTLAGHAGGPPIVGEASEGALVDALERAMDEAGFQTAHLVGNSLGGYLALALASRGRGDTVVALAPAGGWAGDDASAADMLGSFTRMQELARAAVPYVDQILAAPQGRRLMTEYISTNFEHIPTELLAHQLLGVARCDALSPLLEHALNSECDLDAKRITCPVRIAWGTADRVLPWPAAAVRYRDEWLPAADWVLLDGVGHCPQLDVPTEVAELILSFTASGAADEHPARGERARTGA
jgi:pimeloyl-ACP methyl ester carboxylesterase